MAYIPLRTEFTNMTWSPDVPSNNLGPLEYNDGYNIETDTRGIQKILGEMGVGQEIVGDIVSCTGGYRFNNVWTFVVITTAGHFYAVTQDTISDITPVDWTTTYTHDTNFTDDWVGGVLFINDGINAPLFYLPDANPNVINQFGVAPYTSNIWNYEPGVLNVSAAFVHSYNSPNLGNILVAGNLRKTLSNGTVQNQVTTIRWSQYFGQNGIPSTWAPTLFNVANELEIPVRGPIIDGFSLNGNFYICSYWDTVVMAPIAYTTSTAPVFAIRLFNQGRGLLNNNCFVNTDTQVFGLDSRDIWMFDGSSFQSIGNQRVKNWFYNNINPLHSGRTFMVNNTFKNQIEIYFPAGTSEFCNQMISYRYDLNVWNPPRNIADAVSAVESPDFSTGIQNDSKRAIIYARANPAQIAPTQLIQKDVEGVNSFWDGSSIPTRFGRNNIQFPKIPYSASVYTHRILPEITGTGNVEIQVGGSPSVAINPTYQQAISYPLNTNTPWAQINQNESRVTAFAIGSVDSTDSWKLSAVNWQITPTEDTF